MEYRLDHTVLKHRGVGCLRLVAAGAELAKPVIVLHGLGNAKEKTLATLYALAAAGFDAIALDPYLHGDRPEASTREQLLGIDYVRTVADIIYETADDIPACCDELGIDLRQSGMLGISAGGFSAHVLALQPVRCRALVAAISSPDWMRINPAVTPSPSSPEGMLLAATSPISSPERYAPLPVCLLNPASDDIVSPIGSQLLYERLAPLYAEQGIADHLELILYPEGGHYFTDEMLAKSVEWFRKYL